MENVFSQQRGIHHGAGNNPNYLQYNHAVNSIAIGQATVSRKSNAGTTLTVKKGALPYSILSKKIKMDVKSAECCTSVKEAV